MRVKRGVTSHAKHKKIRKATKGFSHPNRVSIKRGRQAVTKSLQFATRDRKNRKRTFRELWNARINAGARLNGTTYSKLIAGLKAGQHHPRPQSPSRTSRQRTQSLHRHRQSRQKIVIRVRLSVSRVLSRAEAPD